MKLMPVALVLYAVQMTGEISVQRTGGNQSPAVATPYTETFYLRASGDGSAPEEPDGAFDAADFNTAGNWDTDDSSDGKIGPNDRVIVLDDDGVFNVQLTVQQSGLSGRPITIQGEVGGSPIVTYPSELTGWDTGGNWSEDDPNQWTFSLNRDPIRVFLAGTEYMMAANAASVDATNRWFWTANTLTVYGTSNPSSFYSSANVATLAANDGPLHIAKDYITVSGIELRGGAASIDINGVDYVVIDSVTFGLYAWYGADLRGSNTYVEIHDSTYASGLDNEGYGSQVPGDGIRLYTGGASGTSYSKFYGNTISNAAHSGINITGTSDGTMVYNEIYENDISAADSNYGRAIELTGTVTNAVRYNQVYRNYMHDLPITALAVNGNENTYSYNIIENVRSTGGVTTTYCGGIYISSDPVKVGDDELIYNNVIYNVANHGIWFFADATHPMADNVFRNNIIMDWDSADTGNFYAITTNDGETDIGAQTFTHNILYKSGVADVIRWKGTDYTVAEFEAASNGGWTASDNVGSDPLFVTPGSDFHLQSGSPARDAGTDVSLTLDYDKVVVPQETNPAIGAYEYIP